MDQLITDIKIYVTEILTRDLPQGMQFHNIRHTIDVVEASTEIGANMSVSANEMRTLLAAAWFHDTGYIRWYIGHEAESGILAAEFLRGKGCASDFITEVLKCIHATMIPQRPETLLQKIMCDADLHHFTKSAYPDYANALRSEFDTFLGLSYTDLDWHRHNLKTLEEHRYFSGYGRDVLSRFKKVNEIRLKEVIENQLHG